MSDLISRQAAIDWLKNEWDGMVISVFKGIENLPSAQPDLSEYSDKLWCNAYERGKRDAQPEQRWIPSGEKPPEEGSYLVWMPFAPPKHRVTVAKYCGGYWNIKTPISAWMPLPEPYKGGEQDE